jgi:hypothetical protein
MNYHPLHFHSEELITKKLQDLYYEINQNCLKYSPIRYGDYDTIKAICPELDQQFTEYNLSVRNSFLFQTSPDLKASSGIHTDIDSDFLPNISLNWPIFYCKNSTMNFYKLVYRAEGRPVLDSSYQRPYILWDRKDCELIDQLELTSPHLIKVSTAHDITPAGPGYRLIISFRFNQSPIHLWPDNN